MRRRLLAVFFALALGVLAEPEARADLSIIPLPEILTDPNEGNTYGFLPVLLLLDQQGRIEHIIAHDIRWNEITGVYPAFRLLGYPSNDQQYFITLRKSQKIDEDYIGQYEESDLLDGRANVLANLTYFRDSRLRFFGFGNASDDAQESNYTQRRLAFLFHVGIRPWSPNWELGWSTRVEDVSIKEGGVDDLPFTGDEFPGTNGLEGSTIHGQGFTLAYDDRDSQTIPSRGTLGAAHVEIIEEALGSSESYFKYGFEVRQFVRLHERFVLAMHGVLDYISGASGAPFYERSSIGGVKSLRGFGEGRFVDSNRFFSTLELRSRAYDRQVFGVDLQVEIAPFLDAGQVFESATELPFDDLHFVGGLGFRGVVPPQVVGFVDLGFGSDGAAVFTGLDYPF